MSYRISPSSICNFLATFLVSSILLIYVFYLEILLRIPFSFYFLHILIFPFGKGGMGSVYPSGERTNTENPIYTQFDSLLDSPSVRQESPCLSI